MFRRHAVAGGGGLLSMGILWSQGSHGQNQPAFAASRPPCRAPSMTTSAMAGGGADERGRSDVEQRPRSQLIFIGCGSSTGVPSPFRLLHPELDTRQSVIDQLSVATPPETNKNYRGNTSVVVRVVREARKGGEGGEARETAGNAWSKGSGDTAGRRERPQVQHLQIDTGKTWREGVIRWFPRHGIPGIDAIVLTHDHADAILGLDDVRGIQDPSRRKTPTPVYLSENTDKSVKRVFPYLVGREEDNGAGGRFVASLKFVVINDFEPFTAAGLQVTAFPVLHGEDYVSHGFLFGPEGNKICYISDVSRVPPESMEFLRKQGPLQLLVCDALLRDRKHPTHFCVEDGVELARELEARRTLLVGLSGDIEYAATNAVLAKREEENGDPHVRCAYDGLAVDIDLV